MLGEKIPEAESACHNELIMELHVKIGNNFKL